MKIKNLIFLIQSAGPYLKKIILKFTNGIVLR